jgi:acyl-CoA reductase-like NAD-dependent aldehyde dehydrogenase
MTKLQAVILRFQALPLEDQDRLADLLNDFTMPAHEPFVLSGEELKILDERLEHVDSETTFTIEEVFKDLQTIEAQIQTLPVDERRELISKFASLITPSEDDIFKLTDAELVELDDRIKNDTETFTMEEVFGPLREKYELRDMA